MVCVVRIELRSWFPEASDEEIDDAVCELEELGLVSRSHTLNSGWRLCLESVYFEKIDHQVMGGHTLRCFDGRRTSADQQDGGRQRTPQFDWLGKKTLQSCACISFTTVSDGMIRKTL